MEKNIVMPQENNTCKWLHNAVNIIKSPIETLRKYYSDVLERDITMKQTLLLINAQAAFLFGILPTECSMWFRVACCVWLLHALQLCKKNL